MIEKTFDLIFEPQKEKLLLGRHRSAQLCGLMRTTGIEPSRHIIVMRTIKNEAMSLLCFYN